jgi:hypothetical protein
MLTDASAFERNYLKPTLGLEPLLERSRNDTVIWSLVPLVVEASRIILRALRVARSELVYTGTYENNLL